MESSPYTLPLKAGQALQRGIYSNWLSRTTRNERQKTLLYHLSYLHACNAWLLAHGDAEVACNLGEGDGAEDEDEKADAEPAVPIFPIGDAVADDADGKEEIDGIRFVLGHFEIYILSVFNYFINNRIRDIEILFSKRMRLNSTVYFSS